MMRRQHHLVRRLLLAALVLGAGGALEGAARATDALPMPATSATPTPASSSTSAPMPSAAASVSADAAERAKRLYAAGAEAFAAQRNADAIAYFRRAAELVPSTKLTYNIGLAYEEMGDAGRALVEYRSFLSHERDADAGRADEVRQRIAKLERHLAETGVQQLFVESDPAGASVRIGGRTLGVTPWAGELPPGRYRVELELAGHSPRQAEVTLAADRAAQLALDLPPAPRQDAGGPGGASRVSPLAWTFLGVGAGALAGGILFELSRASSSHRADRSADPLAAAEARGAADAKQMASLALLGFGAGFGIGGAVLLALDLGKSPPPVPQTAVGVPCAPSFCGVLARGAF